MLVTCSASIRKAWLRDPNSCLASGKQGTKSEAGHLNISPRARIQNTEIVAFIDWSSLTQNMEIWLEESGMTGHKQQMQTRRHHWKDATETVVLPPFPLLEQISEVYQQLSAGTEAWDQTHREHSKFLVSRKSCIPWSKEEALQTTVAVCRFHSIHVKEKHRGFAVLTISFVLSTTIHPEVRCMLFLSPCLPATKHSPAFFSITNLRSTCKK